MIDRRALTASIAILVVAAGALPAPAGATEPKPPPPTAATSIVVDGAEVTIREPRAGGGEKITIYTAAEPTGGRNLLNRLQAQGLAPKSGVSVLVEPDTCAPEGAGYDQAHFLGTNPGCIYYSWRENSFADPQVYFRDHTPAEWPVRASVAEWNKARGVDSYWTTGACPTGGRHCVNVYAGNYGPNWEGGAVAKTYMEVDYQVYFVDGTVQIKFNNYYFTAGQSRRNAACHETGHALGVGHNDRKWSCMYPTQAGSSQIPNIYDIALLENYLYS
ncbi:zinc metalloprotease [Catellatospora vulcania]|uniref:hypothetical protein n=1 Tax=Catellatospora vulcania TaxID=1460450 RepID=UPI0012D423B5|nr:hypothetical protein [Catellatospora vulcania]